MQYFTDGFTLWRFGKTTNQCIGRFGDRWFKCISRPTHFDETEAITLKQAKEKFPMAFKKSND